MRTIICFTYGGVMPTDNKVEVRAISARKTSEHPDCGMVRTAEQRGRSHRTLHGR